MNRMEESSEGRLGLEGISRLERLLGLGTCGSEAEGLEVGKSNKEACGWATEGKRWGKGMLVWEEKEC